MDKDRILSMDPYMLLSFINMKLRDEYESLEELCAYMDIEFGNVQSRLKSIGYIYNNKTNQFTGFEEK